MKRETTLVAGMLILLIAMLAIPLLVPDVLEERHDDVRPSRLSLQEADSTISVLSVPGRTASLQLDTRLAHSGGTSENVTVEIRAVDGESGLLADQHRQSVGTLSGDTTESVLTNLTVVREGSYRIETIVYEDGNRVARGTRTISGVEALTPDYADSPVDFERFRTSGRRLPSITYSASSVDGNRTTLDVSSYLTNSGNDAAGDVTVVVRARQAESNVIAATAERDVDSIRPGRTVSPSVTLTVPDSYNYYLDALLMKDGVVIATASEIANLDPTRVVEEDEQTEDVEFETGDFTDEATRTAPSDDGDRRTSVEQGPGFGVSVALVALLGTALLIARRQTND